MRAFFLSLFLLPILSLANEQVTLASLSSLSEKLVVVDCGQPEDAITIKSITVSPDPPQPGQNLTLTAVGTVNVVIEAGAYADVTVKLGLIKLIQKRFDVCEEAQNANASIQCPVQPGEYELVQTVALPKEIPPAKFSVSVRGFTADELDMVCMDLKIDFMPGKPKELKFW